MVLRRHGIAPFFIKFDSWGGFYFYYIHQENKSDKEEKISKNLGASFLKNIKACI